MLVFIRRVVILGVTCFMSASSSSAAAPVRVLHSFSCNTADGSIPNGGVAVDRAGNLYGTTSLGGTHGFGTVFKLSRSGSGWVERIIHNFGEGDDGINPIANVVMRDDGNLYGTTVWGNRSCGTVYSLRADASGNWTETILHNFAYHNDGCQPAGALILDKNGNLYGTTHSGGTYGYGTVFELSPEESWKETLLHSFGGFNDGASPLGQLTLDSEQNVYGTTGLGGIGTNFGTVYKLTRSDQGWDEQLLYSAEGGEQGMFVTGSVALDDNGNLYGTTSQGGGGVAFELSRTSTGWTSTILHEFSTFSGGMLLGEVTLNAGELYGFAAVGGSKTACNGYGCGTVFKLTRSGQAWSETVLHAFTYEEGSAPNGITFRNGHIFGTTRYGGSYGCGTVFELQP